MDYLNLLLRPNSFWAKIIYALEGNLLNVVLAVIVLTVIIKAVLLPVDIYNKINSKVNMRKQQKIKPQIDKIKKTYANNPTMINQKTNEVYKKEGVNGIGSCLSMLVTLVLTSAVFLTLLTSITSIGSYNQTVQYIEVRDAYYLNAKEVLVTNYADLINEKGFDINNLTNENINLLIEEEKEVLELIKEDVTSVYLNNRDSFYWVKNVWAPDTTGSAVSKYKNFTKAADKGYLKEIGVIYAENDKDITIQEAITESEYNNVYLSISADEYKTNGYFLLPLLAVIVTFVSMQIPVWTDKLKQKRQGYVKNTGEPNMQAMSYIMSIILGVFVVTNNAAFGLYVVTGSIFTLIATPFITMLTNAIDNKIIEKQEKKVTVSYSRKNIKK